MRTIECKINDDLILTDVDGQAIEPQGCIASLGWKADPELVLQEVDKQLGHNFEIVIYETGDDSYYWSIETRESK